MTLFMVEKLWFECGGDGDGDVNGNGADGQEMSQCISLRGNGGEAWSNRPDKETEKRFRDAPSPVRYRPTFSNLRQTLLLT